MSLFDQESIDFFQRITSREAEQIVDWARTALASRVAGAAETQHLMHMIAHRVVQALEFILLQRASADDLLLKQPIFIQYYAMFLRSRAQQDVQRNDTQRKFEAKMQRKVERRDERRTALLVQIAQSDRFASVAEWFERDAPTTSAAQFDIVVETFIDHLAQRMLEKALQHLIFPVVKIE